MQALGHVNAAGKGRQKWQATAGTKFTNLVARLIAEPEPCMLELQWSGQTAAPDQTSFALSRL